MTISAFCRSQLLEHGPLTLEVLTAGAVAAGKTRSRSPMSTVRSAIAHKELLLPDGRWATPLWLLEGRTLTTRGLAHEDAWDGDVDEVDTGERASHDLDLLQRATRSGQVPLATGGALKADLYSQMWRAPKDWPHVQPGPGELLALRVQQGVLHVDVIRQTCDIDQRGTELAADAGRLDRRRRDCWGGDVAQISGNLTDQLVARLVTDPEFLRDPLPPLSECIPPLDNALRRRHHAWIEERHHWRPQLTLPGELREIASDEARGTDQLPEEWLQDFVSRALRDLDGRGYGRVLQLLPRA
jgi:hypothetical protein